MTNRTERSFRDELPRLIEQRKISHRQFAAAIGVAQSYLSRVLSGERVPSERLLVSAAEELGLSPDYFAEYRELVVTEAVKDDAQLRDRIYKSLTRNQR